MKNCFFILTFFVAFFAKAQNPTDALFTAQMQVLLLDVPQNFESFKGYLIEEKDSSETYTSKMTLPGTTKNEIRTNSKGAYYIALIAPAVYEADVNKMISTWKEKLATAIDKGYKEMPIDEKEQHTVRRGVWLVHNNYTAGILLVKKEGDETYTMQLIIMLLN